MPARLVMICPVFNEGANIRPFFDRVMKVSSSLDPIRYEFSLLFMNNRSTDDTLSLIEEIEASHRWVYHITLSRNFGYQLSVLCGISSFEADLYMVCDVDCEDPPEMLLDFLNQIEEGRDIAYGMRNNRPDPLLMGFLRHSFYQLLRRVGDFTMVPYMAEFCMFRRHVRDAIIANSSTFPFVRAEIGYVGFDIAGLPYRREARKYGRSHYNYLRAFTFAWSGILASSTFPLRAAMYSFPALTLVNVFLVAVYALGGMRFEATVVGLLGMNSLYLTAAVAFISIYVSRIYHNGLGRRRFIVDHRLSRMPDSVE